MLSSWLLLLWLAATLVADQVLKHIVLTGEGAARVLEIGPAVRIRPIRTRGAVAERLGVHPALLAIIWVGCLLAVLLVAPRAGRFEGPLAQAALGAALGGAAGNLRDVVRRKSVVDFVQIGPWPVFNFADVAIVSGVIVALLAG
jgi:lipoprotein signal peptidase